MRRSTLIVLGFGPPLFCASVRAALDWQEGRQPPPEAFALAPLQSAPTLWGALLPGLLVVFAVLLLGGALAWWWRRGGAVAARRVLWSVWVLLWLGAALGLLLAHANRQELRPQAVAQAKVLGLRARAPNLHQTGGSEVVLAIEGVTGAQRVLVGDARAAAWRPGTGLSVQLARGRYWGWYLTGWESPGAVE